MQTAQQQPNFALLLVIVWLLAILQLVAQHWVETGQTLIDTDDAMRLTQMYDWLGGRGWYDLNQPRVAPIGYEAHWSRLVDAALAGTLWIFTRFTDAALAERLMRTVWPALWLLVAMAGIVATVWRVAGRNGALVALVLLAVGKPAYAQFLPGRVDHHNVQIALSMLVLAATVWSDRVRWAPAAAGALTALALAIGLECLSFLVVCGAAMGARYAFDRAGARPAADYGLALAASSAAAFLLVVGPDHWARTLCDAVAINMTAPIIVAGLGLALAGRLAHQSAGMRLGMVLTIGVVAIGLFAAMEPRCLKGPFGMVDPALASVWLDHVSELETFPSMTRGSPAMGAGFAAFPLAGLICALILMREREMRGDFGFLVSTAMLMAAVVMMMMLVKMSYYAMWFAMPLVAAIGLRLIDRLRLQSVAARFLLAVLLAPAVLTAAALSVVQAAASAPSAPQYDIRRKIGCFNLDSYVPLARLPAGVVATDIDFGPHLLALTPHRILTAPYHRLSANIIAMHHAFAAPPDDARRMLATLGVDYLMTCGLTPLDDLAGPRTRASLWGRLRTNDVPDWLEPVDLKPPFNVWRVKPL
jgi:lipoprotein signal peptidase